MTWISGLAGQSRSFNAIEMCVRRHLTINQTNKMDETFKQKLIDIVLNDDVLFYWCLVGQIEGDEAADTSLAMIIKMWVTIRGFSFAKNVMEIYKHCSGVVTVGPSGALAPPSANQFIT